MYDYKEHIDNLNNAKQSLYPSMRVVLYSESILKDQDISSFCNMIRNRYPDITEALDS